MQRTYAIVGQLLGAESRGGERTRRILCSHPRFRARLQRGSPGMQRPVALPPSPETNGAYDGTDKPQ